jgi:predicted DCC family thiol-disulfide oxidoreductase YuxK
VQGAPAGGEGPRGLTILYDADCPLCARGRRRLEARPAYVALAFLAFSSPEAHVRYGELPRLGSGLVVVGDRGEVWTGRAAYLVTLWALRGQRERSYRERDEPRARDASFGLMAARRRVLALWFEHRPCAGREGGREIVPAGPYR